MVLAGLRTRARPDEGQTTDEDRIIDTDDAAADVVSPESLESLEH
jgi:hypothetical protein